MQPTRVPPQDSEAEKSVLGALLLDKDAILSVAQFLRPEHFYVPANAAIYEAILHLSEEGQAADIITLSAALKRDKQLKKVGGMSYLTDLVNAVPTASNIATYADIVADLAVRREMIKAAGEITELGYDDSIEVKELVDQAEKKLFDLSSDNIKKSFTPIRELVKEAYSRATELQANKGKVRGIPSGLTALDNVIGGFQESNLIILAARPSVGKTSLALDIARHATINEKKRVAVFSLEMSEMELIDRLIAAQVEMSLWDYKMGELKESEESRLLEAMDALSEAPLYIDDVPGQHIVEMRTKARRLAMEVGLDMIIIDYLQLIVGDNKENRVQEVSAISRQLKNLARELHIPVMALSQLSRAVETRDSRIPQLSDLRESGAIEQDADVVIFIHREEQYNFETERPGIADLIIAKHRNGPTGQVEVGFQKEQTRYYNRDISQQGQS